MIGGLVDNLLIDDQDGAKRVFAVLTGSYSESNRVTQKVFIIHENSFNMTWTHTANALGRAKAVLRFSVLSVPGSGLRAPGSGRWALGAGLRPCPWRYHTAGGLAE